MTYRRHEIVLEPVEFLETFVGCSELRRRHLELPRLLLELARIDDQLRGFVKNMHDLIDVAHLLSQNRCDHDARGRGSEHAGKLALRRGDDVRVGGAVIVKVSLALALKRAQVRRSRASRR